MSQGEGTPRGHTGASFLFMGLSFLLGRLPPLPPLLGDLCCYIFLSSIYPPPTFVSHPCLSSSARPIGDSSWRSVSYCGAKASGDSGLLDIKPKAHAEEEEVPEGE